MNLRKIYRTIKPVINRGTDNSICLQTQLCNSTITINGSHNCIKIGRGCIINNCNIIISGNNNHLIIDDTARLLGGAEIILDGDATLHIGRNAGIRKVSFIAKGAKIDIGELCMFSNNIIVRNHDSHKVLMDGKIVNQAKNIVIGRHVWIGQNVTILKGVVIGDNSILALGSVITKSCPSGCIMAGNPAKIVKNDVSWDY